MRFLLVALLTTVALAQGSLASAATNWEVVYGYGAARSVTATGFDSYSQCEGYLEANGLLKPYHCEAGTAK